MDKNNRADAFGIDAFAAELGRANKRFFIICIVLIVTLISTNLAWTIYNNQFMTETVAIEAEQDFDGSFNKALIIGGDYGGETEGTNK